MRCVRDAAAARRTAGAVRYRAPQTPLNCYPDSSSCQETPQKIRAALTTIIMVNVISTVSSLTFAGSADRQVKLQSPAPANQISEGLRLDHRLLQVGILQLQLRFEQLD